MSKIITYKVEDIFEDIDGDEDNVLMNIPPEISERMGWVEGDTLKITVEDGNLTIVKVEESNGEEQ
jgi:AbrB family looped-hinge helix DNA binding protein